MEKQIGRSRSLGLWCAICLVLCSSPANGEEADTLWLGIPDSAPESYRILEDRLLSAMKKSGLQITQTYPDAAPKIPQSTVALQTNMILGINLFYDGKLEVAFQRLLEAMRSLDEFPDSVHAKVVSPSQVKEAAMLLVRLYLGKGDNTQARERLHWLLFSFPDTSISLEKYPSDVVNLAESIRRSMQNRQGSIQWEALSQKGQCILSLDGFRRFEKSPIFVPAGEYDMSFQCGDVKGWRRKLQVTPNQKQHVQGNPDIEHAFAVTPKALRLQSWPPTREFLVKAAVYFGQPVATVLPRVHPGKKGSILVVERITPEGGNSHIAWTDAPDSALTASATALVFGNAPRPSSESPRGPRPSSWAWGAYGTGSALLLGGMVTNLLHNQETGTALNASSVESTSAMRNTSVALYSIGGISVITGLILHLANPPHTPRDFSEEMGFTSPPNRLFTEMRQ